MIYIISYTPQGGEEFSVVVFAVFAIVLLFMHYQVLPIIVLLKWFYSEIAFNTKYFVMSYSIDVVDSFLLWRHSV